MNEGGRVGGSPVFRDVMKIKAVRSSSARVPIPSKPGLSLWARILGYRFALNGLPWLKGEYTQ